MAQRILMVDDEPRILDGLRRTLHAGYTVVTANSGAEGLELQRAALAEGDPFGVIVSDMMMPGMNGAQFLTAAREVDPDAVRIILSGQADLASTIAAVNDAGLFRFLTKPCEPTQLTGTLNEALAHRRLVSVEKDLIERTLRGAIDTLTQLLSMASPEAFSRTSRIKELTDQVGAALGVDDWRLPMTAMLSQIGCVAIPTHVLHRVETGAELDEEERALYLAHPAAGRALLERIPRLEEIADWVGAQPLAPDGAPPEHAPLSQRIFCASASFLAGYEATGNFGRALNRLQRAGHYDRPMLEALLNASRSLTPTGVVREVRVADVRPGMLLEQDVVTNAGLVLVRKGERITDTLALRLENFAMSVGIVEPIVVLDGV